MPAPVRVVICCVPEEFFRYAHPALSENGIDAELVPERAFLDMPRRTNTGGMIYRPDPRRSENAPLVVTRWKTFYPARPLILYLERGPYRASLAARFGRLPAVVSWTAESGTIEQQAPVLAEATAALVAKVPEMLIRELMDLATRGTPSGLIGFVEALLDRLRQGGIEAPTVADLATRCHLPIWTIRRACRSSGLPLPERLVEWLNLIYVLAVADWEQISVARAAAQAGLSTKYVRGLRRKLLPDVTRLSKSRRRETLFAAIERFARTCGLPRPQAADVAARLGGR
ncbi:MAG: hypothetical protein KatS3mg081_2095 [Gemmatimonadales bacterium]|nr:MAG: hypothetical protein KatS3mg081_2095 [Gemmatimonadales bacterium]